MQSSLFTLATSSSLQALEIPTEISKVLGTKIQATSLPSVSPIRKLFGDKRSSRGGVSKERKVKGNGGSQTARIGSLNREQDGEKQSII
jgi:hypothetical protein